MFLCSDSCPRKRLDCSPMSNIIAHDEATDAVASFVCMGRLAVPNVNYPQDEFRLCFKSAGGTDTMFDHDKHDLLSMSSVISAGLLMDNMDGEVVEEKQEKKESLYPRDIEKFVIYDITDHIIHLDASFDISGMEGYVYHKGIRLSLDLLELRHETEMGGTIYTFDGPAVVNLKNRSEPRSLVGSYFFLKKPIRTFIPL